MIIAIEPTTDGIHASIYGHPELWSIGKTKEEAIGKLLMVHAKRIDVKIIDTDTVPDNPDDDDE